VSVTSFEGSTDSLALTSMQLSRFTAFFSLHTDILSNALGQVGILNCFTAKLCHAYSRRSAVAPTPRFKTISRYILH